MCVCMSVRGRVDILLFGISCALWHKLAGNVSTSICHCVFCSFTMCTSSRHVREVGGQKGGEGPGKVHLERGGIALPRP